MDDGGSDEGDWDDPEELDWKWIDVDFLDDDNTTDRATTHAVNVRPSRNVMAEHAGSRCRGLTSKSRSR